MQQHQHQPGSPAGQQQRALAYLSQGRALLVGECECACQGLRQLSNLGLHQPPVAQDVQGFLCGFRAGGEAEGGGLSELS
jgi:hypothetical protein